MIRLFGNERGATNGIVAALMLTIILFFGAAGFGVWAFLDRQSLKSGTDKITLAAVDAARKQAIDQKDREFAEREKLPAKQYKGSEAFGSLSFEYPRTWSALISETTVANPGNIPIDGYFYPDFLPGTSNLPTTFAFALRVRVSSTSYSTVIGAYDAPAAAGKVRVIPFKLSKVDGALGVRVEGEISTGKTGIIIVMPLRDKTIEVWTEGTQFTADFNNQIVPSMNFVP